MSIPRAASAYPVECLSMYVNRERQPSGFASPLNHASNAHPAERLAALVDEDVSRASAILGLLPVQ